MLAAHMATGTHGQDTPSPLPAACRPPPLFSPPPPASPTASPSLPPPTLPLAFWPLPAPPPLHSPLPSLRHHRYPHRSLPHRHRPSPQPPSPPPPLTAASLTATAPSLPPKAVLTEATGGSLKYNLTVRAAAACPVGRCTAPQRDGGSGAATFFGVLLGGAALYLVGGMAYNVRSGVEGIDRIPHWHFWQRVPQLAADGELQPRCSREAAERCGRERQAYCLLSAGASDAYRGALQLARFGRNYARAWSGGGGAVERCWAARARRRLTPSRPREQVAADTSRSARQRRPSEARPRRRRRRRRSRHRSATKHSSDAPDSSLRPLSSLLPSLPSPA